MKKPYIILLIVVLLPVLVLSQELEDVDNSKTKKVSKIFNYKNEVSNFLQLQQVSRNFTNTPTQQSGNNVVMIQQIGFNNNVISNVSSKGISDISHLQSGNDNFINSTSTVNNVSEQIFQSGNNNKVTNFTFGNVDSASLNILQNGNNLTVERFGTNSQTNKMSIKLLGNSQSVIIRSF
ncbi:hypothetical protein [Winogradskyella haliclonae]|uniref:Curlin associated repeat-containing protein n=1 Tax=Winogradskyella haliclonae TaxID=2048558 RepID=A0ABQ2C1R4_9FLAO|nr:hypothetical protein [Winogradskyella haliclonae]GGI58175.1 hypothetical protein GCM10011444_24840 [Winogradskyella haliclonae]